MYSFSLSFSSLDTGGRPQLIPQIVNMTSINSICSYYNLYYAYIDTLLSRKSLLEAIQEGGIWIFPQAVRNADKFSSAWTEFASTHDLFHLQKTRLTLVRIAQVAINIISKNVTKDLNIKKPSKGYVTRGKGFNHIFRNIR